MPSARLSMRRFGRVLVGICILIATAVWTPVAQVGGAAAASAPRSDLPPSEELGLEHVERTFVYSPPEAPPAPPASQQSKIRICSWNIRRFGRQHLDAQIAVMARVLQVCDVAVIQEIKHPTGSIRLWRQLQRMTNITWGYLLTPRTGRTPGEKEQYVFIWRLDHIRLTDPGASAASSMAREPYYGFFGVTNPGPNAFTFLLVVTHTKPGEITTELQRLLASYRVLRLRFQQGEPDVILAGDLNAGLRSAQNDRTADRRFTALFGQYQLAIRQPVPATMVDSRFVNDNLLWDQPTIEDYARSSGIELFDIPRRLETQGISDHRLVWAEFWTNHDSR